MEVITARIRIHIHQFSTEKEVLPLLGRKGFRIDFRHRDTPCRDHTTLVSDIAGNVHFPPLQSNRQSGQVHLEKASVPPLSGGQYFRVAEEESIHQIPRQELAQKDR